LPYIRKYAGKTFVIKYGGAVVVHGGGKKITSLLDKLQIDSEFVDGLRVTTKESIEIIEMVLSGNDNGKYGLVGNIQKINSQVIEKLINESFVPVVAPIAATEDIDGIGLNINADLVASKIAGTIKAEKIIFMTDTPGVLDEDSELLSTLNHKEIKALIENNVINGGMLPKVEACLEAINMGCKKAHIIDGRIEHSILLEVFTSDGIGTVIK